MEYSPWEGTKFAQTGKETLMNIQESTQLPQIPHELKVLWATILKRYL